MGEIPSGPDCGCAIWPKTEAIDDFVNPFNYLELRRLAACLLLARNVHSEQATREKYGRELPRKRPPAVANRRLN